MTGFDLPNHHLAVALDAVYLGRSLLDITEAPTGGAPSNLHDACKALTR